MFIAALLTRAKIWKQPKCSLTDEWIKKMWYIYIQWNITQPDSFLKTHEGQRLARAGVRQQWE